MTRKVLITALVAPLIISFGLATAFALLGLLTNVGVQVVVLASAYVVMAIVLTRSAEKDRGANRP